MIGSFFDKVKQNKSKSNQHVSSSSVRVTRNQLKRKQSETNFEKPKVKKKIVFFGESKCGVSDDVEEELVDTVDASGNESDRAIRIRRSKGKQVVNDLKDDVAVKSGRKKRFGMNKFRSLRTRMSPHSLFKALNNLSVLQKNCLFDIGFGKLYKMPCDGLAAHIGYYVVDNFDPITMTLKLQNAVIKITPQLIHDMLGIPFGGINLFDLPFIPDDHRLLVSWFSQFPSGKAKSVRPTEISEIIVNSSEAGMLFKQNFLMLFLNTMAECNNGGICNTTVLNYVDEQVAIEDIDWCEYVYSCLHVSKVGWDRNCSGFYIGPATFLVVSVSFVFFISIYF